MDQLISVSLAFPTVIFSILVVVSLVYWLFVILGALDIDLVGDADVDVGGDIGGDIGGDVGGDIGGDVGGDIGGDAGGDIGGDGADGHAGHHHGGAGILAALGLRKVPLTISVSLISLFAWLICIVIMLALDDFDLLPVWLLKAVVFFAALFLSLPPAALCAKPIAPFFVVHKSKSRKDYVGNVCKVMTGEVTGKFGQARIEEGGYVLDVPVRCDSGHKFSRHDQALIIDYDSERDAYLIEPMDEVLGKKKKAK